MDDERLIEGFKEIVLYTVDMTTDAEKFGFILRAMRVHPAFANLEEHILQEQIAGVEKMRDNAMFNKELSADAPVRMITEGRTEEFKQYLSLHPETIDTDNGPLKQTYMHYATMHDRAEIVEHLLQMGSQAQTIPDAQGSLPISNFVHSCGFAVLDVFIRNNVDLNEFCHPTNENIIQLAIYRSKMLSDSDVWPEIIRTLIVGGATTTLTEIEPFLPTEEDVLRIRHRIFFQRSLLGQLLLVMG